MLKKTVGNWVDGDRFFDREDDLTALQDRVGDGMHTRLTGQRRMGKTSLVRELVRRLELDGKFKMAFVDLEDARDAADAIAAVTQAAAPLLGRNRGWGRKWDEFRELLRSSDSEVRIGPLSIRLRETINRGNWKRTGDQLMRDLAALDSRVVLAMDELPVLVTRLLRNDGNRDSAGSVASADEFLSWLRKVAQAHRGRTCLILSGSIGIATILKRFGLSATMNVFSPYELRPWSPRTASDCLAALASTYDLTLAAPIRAAFCSRIRSCVPHHVQQFFEAVHRHLRIANSSRATLEIADRAYREDMLGARGQIDMDHYENRLRLVLGPDESRVARQLLARAARTGGLDVPAAVPFVADILEQDGYLIRQGQKLRFVSGLLEDWQRARQGLPVDPLSRATAPGWSQ